MTQPHFYPVSLPFEGCGTNSSAGNSVHSVDPQPGQDSRPSPSPDYPEKWVDISHYAQDHCSVGLPGVWQGDTCSPQVSRTAHWRPVFHGGIPTFQCVCSCVTGMNPASLLGVDICWTTRRRPWWEPCGAHIRQGSLT